MRERGFTYAMVLVAIVVIGIVAEAAHLTTARVLRADREAELLYRGLAYRRAIASYYELHGRFPRQIEDLVRDPASASRRHLRDAYRDPLAPQAGKAADDAGWRLIEAADGGFNGIASTSSDTPLKRASFPPGLEKFEEAETYADWIFFVEPRQLVRGRPIQVPPPQPENPTAPAPATPVVPGSRGS